MNHLNQTVNRRSFLRSGIAAGAFPHDPADDWFRQQPDDGPQELTYVDEDTFWSEF